VEHGFTCPSLDPLPRFESSLDVEPTPARDDMAIALSEGDFDPDWDDADGAPVAEIEEEIVVDAHIDWRDPFESFFLVDSDVELPEDGALIASLAVTTAETFQDETALWNLALCLAYGSADVGDAAARAFFAAVPPNRGAERLDWMVRTLRGNGFVHSGISADAGQRGVHRLRQSCPPSLSAKLS
jgi:hypothetical protein